MVTPKLFDETKYDVYQVLDMFGPRRGITEKQRTKQVTKRVVVDQGLQYDGEASIKIMLRVSVFVAFGGFATIMKKS